MMKFLALVFVIGCASASFYDALEKASDDVVADFVSGMDIGQSLKSSLGYGTYSDEAEEIEGDIKTQLGKTLKEALDNTLAKIRDAVEHGKEVSKELVNKAKEIADKLKELGQSAGDKAKELVDKIKEKARDWLKNLLEKIGVGKRSIKDFIQDLISQINVEALLQQLKDKIAEKVDVEAIKTYIKKVFGETSALGHALLETIKAKGLEAIRALIARILPGHDSEYSLKEAWESIKDFIKELKGDLADKFAKFTVWLKETVKNGVDNTKEKIGKMKELAKETIAHGKTLSKEAAREALEFFQPYKEDLGSLWDEIKDTVSKAIRG